MSKLLIHSFMLVTFVVTTSAALCSEVDKVCPNVIFPEKKDLRSSFNKEGLDHFADNTNILNIVDCELNLDGVVKRLEEELDLYNEYMKKQGGRNSELAMATIMISQNLTIIRILLQNDVRALRDYVNSY